MMRNKLYRYRAGAWMAWQYTDSEAEAEHYSRKGWEVEWNI